MVRFEDVQSTSLTLVLSCENGSSENQVGFTLWHRKADDADYPAEPTCILRQPKARCAVMGLSPATKYHFKIVQFEGTRELREFEVQFSTIREVEENPGCLEIERSQSHATNCSDLSNPSSVEDETTDILPYGDRTDNLGKTPLPIQRAPKCFPRLSYRLMLLTSVTMVKKEHLREQFLCWMRQMLQEW